MDSLLRQRLSFVILAAWIFAACSPVLDSAHVSFENYELWKKPKHVPEALPLRFLYKSAAIKMAAHYGGSGGFSFQRQGVIIQKSTDSKEKIYTYYSNAFARGDWHIIQSQNDPQTGLAYIMAESSSRRLLTIILRGESPVTIKIYYKPGNY